MEASIASAAILGILNACDDKTKESVMKHFSVQQITPKAQKKACSVTLFEAKEELIINYFKH
jgi:hypothetical protein